MDLLTVLFVLCLVGIVLWVINTYVPMDAKIKKIINVVTVILVVFWLLKSSKLLDELRKVHVSAPPATTFVLTDPLSFSHTA